MSTPITVIGTIATDVKQVVTQSGVMLASFRLASGERRYDRQQQKWVDGDTNWYGVTAFRTLGEHAQESFRKGERVIVSGRLRVRQWESGEKSGTSVDIEADAIGHDIRWGISRFEKRNSLNDSGDQPAAPAAIDTGTGLIADSFIPEVLYEEAPFSSAEIEATPEDSAQRAA